MVEDDSPETPATPMTVYNTPKGGAYGGPISPLADLDPNVRALPMDYRWTTAFNGPIPATALKYSFPQQLSDYTVVPGYRRSPGDQQVRGQAGRRQRRLIAR
jgi:hypothetical protein